MALNNYTALSALDSNAVIQNYSKELRRKAIPRDIYTNVRADTILWDGGRMAIPQAIYTPIAAKDSSMATTVRITMKMPLNGNPLLGGTVAIGTEIAPVIRTATLYRNNYRIVVQDEPGYGVDRLDAAPYRLYQEHVNDLGPHAGAYEGLQIRMALVESYPDNLQGGVTSATCVAQFNPNFYVCGALLNQQPRFHTTSTTYVSRICSAINTANGGMLGAASGMLSCRSVDAMVVQALRRRMKPVSGKRPYFVLTISDVQAANFSNPDVSGSMGARFIQQNTMSNMEQQNWNGMLGRYTTSSGVDVFLVVDERLPILNVSGTGAPYSMSAQYMWPTDNDDRDLTDRHSYDACILHGQGAIVNLEPEKLHYVKDNYDYGVRNGYGYAGVRGIQLLQFDTTPVTGAGTAREYWGSMIVVAARAQL